MRHLRFTTIALLLASSACGGSQPAPSAPPASTAEANESGPSAAAEPTSTGAERGPAAQNPGAEEFVVQSRDAGQQTPQPASKIKGTRSEAALKFTVVDKDKGPIPGIIISLTGADGRKFYTEETSAEGYAELLVPVGQKYELVYLGLGRKDMAAAVTVTDEPNQNIRLTLRYKRHDPPKQALAGADAEPRFVLDGVTFDSGKATIRAESFPRLDGVVEYLTHKKSAQIEISGHTDNAGNPKTNKLLSEKRAQACRDYLISKGIEGSRIKAVGYGDERPIASNDSEEGRQQNRRIEATEL